MATSGASRNSHDLSLLPRDATRDSLVDNMLLSLDQFSMGQAGAGTGCRSPSLTHGEPGAWPNGSVSRGNDGMRRQHSYSSDADADADAAADDLSRASTQIPREGRSNSASHCHGVYPRLPSLKETTHRGQPGAPLAVHSRGDRGSAKRSSSASIDAGYPPSVAGNQRWAGGGGFRRSASFDFEPLRTQQQQPPFHLEFSRALTSDDYAAAPTPTVPGGPRRVPSAMTLPPPPPEPFELHGLERKHSASRSVKSSSGRGKRAASSQVIAPAMPLSDFGSAPAPSVSYGKSRADPPAAQFNCAPAQQKERQGFFRRVFGSSKASSTSSVPADAQSPSRLATSTTTAPPSQVTSSSSHSHPVLQKKPSLFFRRRKKAVADEFPPPLLDDLPPVPPLADPSLKESPASSLEKIMNPYLREGAAETTPLGDITNTMSGLGEGGEERREYQRDFSPDYEPSPNAKIRAVASDPDHEPSWSGESPVLQPSQRLGKGFQSRSSSFFNLDAGSDNDESPIRRSKKCLVNDKENVAGTTSSRVAHKPRDPNSTIRAKKKPTYNLEQADPDDGAKRPKLTLYTNENRSMSLASGSTETDYRTAPSASPSVRIEEAREFGPQCRATLKLTKPENLDDHEFVVGQPTEDDRQKAQRIYDGAEDFIHKDKAAAWMGEEGPVCQRTLRAYIALYDFTDLSILNAMRKVCGRLVLRGETQQVDRILVAFSKRWCDCNPNHGFKATDIIHTICYSIILLNTDLHLADIEQKMTRSQFVKNTLTTIVQAVAGSVPKAFDRPSILPEKNSMLSGDNMRPSTDHDRRTFRHSFRPPPRTDTQPSDAYDGCGPLVKAPFYGSMRAWEEQIEVVLKSIYASIRDHSLPLFGAEPERYFNNAPSQSSLSVMGMLKRSPSVLSKAPSESQMSARGRIADSGRTSAARWTSKSRSRPGLGRTGLSSSRTSFEDSSSLWSPALSSATWSRYSLGRTQGSMSQDSLGSSMPRGDYQQSIGFANALSQAIVRDEDANGPDDISILSADVLVTQLMEDESLELAGPPWVKEGRVMHKHHLDGVGNRAKERSWAEVFAVIQRGQMSLFSFNVGKSLRQKSRFRSAGKSNAPVGGGNWQDNAVNLGTFNLRLTLASALPAPGYSRTRPYVWAWSLPTGAVHLFQVGTPEIIKEFVNTANYWSARLSTHPLVGGISNIEYGWSDAVVNNSLVNAINDSSSVSITSGMSGPGSSATHARSPSVQSGSFQSSSFDQGSASFTNNCGRGKLPGDRIHVSGWTPPTQSMRPSNLPEAEQLGTLTAYVKSIEGELQAHNQFRSPMLLAFTPRGHNAGKAMANWERKSAYLLREIVKFRNYVDALQQAEHRKREIYKERDLARRAARGELSDGDIELSGDEEGDETLRP